MLRQPGEAGISPLNLLIFNGLNKKRGKSKLPFQVQVPHATPQSSEIASQNFRRRIG